MGKTKTKNSVASCLVVQGNKGQQKEMNESNLAGHITNNLSIRKRFDKNSFMCCFS